MKPRRSLAVLLSVTLAASLLAVPASAAAVVRRTPTAIRLAADPAAGIAWGKTTTLKATLLDEAGKPLPNERLMVLRSVQGSVWTTVTSVYSTSGSYQISVASGQAVTRFRAAFRGDAEHRPAMEDVVVLPQAYLTIECPRSVYLPDTFMITGNLRPRHAQGKSWVTLQCDQLVGTTWRRQRNLPTSTRDWNSFSQHYSEVKLPYTGQWRIRAYHGDVDHAPTCTSWVYIAVKPDTRLRINGSEMGQTGFYRLAKGTHQIDYAWAPRAGAIGGSAFSLKCLYGVPPTDRRDPITIVQLVPSVTAPYGGSGTVMLTLPYDADCSFYVGGFMSDWSLTIHR